MSRAGKFLAITLTLLGLGSVPAAHAAGLGYSRMLKPQLDHIIFKTATMGPFAYTHFCLRYADDCKEHGHAFRRPHQVIMTDTRWSDLVEINRQVNRSIVPRAYNYNSNQTYDTWRIAPVSGDCNDYAVTKRHELLARGWPSRSLLLAEVVTAWGEHHLVLVVRTNSQDLVLDNLNANVKLWSKTPYQWVRIQSPSDQSLWSTLKTKTELVVSL